MRVTKKHEDRKNEILDVAERLFYSKGFENCTVNDILKEVGIAKGTFYHYFKSKEETLEAVVERSITIMASRIKEAIRKEEYKPDQKLMNVFLAMRMGDDVDDKLLEDLHKSENALLHQKNLSQMVETISPILVEIIEEGTQKGYWNCRYPLEYMQIFLASALTLTDDGIFKFDAEAQMKVMAALISILEMMLEVPENSFMELYIQNWDTISR